MLAPLDRGSCVSSRRFVHFFLKCAPLPHKTITAQTGSFLLCHLDGDSAWEVLKKWASSALRNMSSFLRGAETSDPCRGFGSPRPAFALSCSPRGLQSATPVEDSALRIQRHFPFIPSRGANERPLSRNRLSPPSLHSFPSLPRRLQSMTSLFARGESARPSGRVLSWVPPCAPW